MQIGKKPQVKEFFSIHSNLISFAQNANKKRDCFVAFRCSTTLRPDSKNMTL